MRALHGENKIEISLAIKWKISLYFFKDENMRNNVFLSYFCCFRKRREPDFVT